MHTSLVCIYERIMHRIYERVILLFLFILLALLIEYSRSSYSSYE